MFATANVQQCSELRSEFAKYMLDDWRKILVYASHIGIVSSRESGPLLDALDEVEATGQRIRTELFWSYFRALEGVRTKTFGRDVRSRILGLGNVLVESLARNGTARPIPVWAEDDGWVDLPAASTDRNPVLRVRGATLEAEQITELRREILDATQVSWTSRPRSGIGLRAATLPILLETARYADEATRLRSLRGWNVASSNLEVLDATSASGASIVGQLGAAAAFVGETDHALAAELSMLTEYVVPLEGNSDFVGGSALTLYGATFLKLRNDWSVLCYADHLIHEAAHQLMHAAQELQPLLLNRDYLGAPSPIRSDPRPLYGSFHATFVFLRLSLFMQTVMQRTTRSEVRDEAAIRFHRHLLGLLQGLDTLITYGEFTIHGRAELDLWIDIASSLRDSHGGPDPEISARLTWDYEPPRDLSIPKRFRRRGDR